MSSTGRGGQRREDDFYATPGWAAAAILRRVGPLAGKRILEPSAGDGAIVRELLSAGAHPDMIAAVEPNAERFASVSARVRESHCCAFEEYDALGYRFDLVVANPPFADAQAHVEKAISLLTPGGLCVALLRLSFSCSKKRKPFRAAHPFDMFIHARRLSFITDECPAELPPVQVALPGFDDEIDDDNGAVAGATDSADYAWFWYGTTPDGIPCGGRFEMIEEGP